PRTDFYSYLIYRKLNEPGQSYRLYKEVRNRKDTTFRDSNVLVNKYSYVYKVLTNTQCGISSPDGNYGTSILLQGSSEPFINHLSWNQYELWKGGVTEYDIERV